MSVAGTASRLAPTAATAFMKSRVGKRLAYDVEFGSEDNLTDPQTSVDVFEEEEKDAIDGASASYQVLQASTSGAPGMAVLTIQITADEVLSVAITTALGASPTTGAAHLIGATGTFADHRADGTVRIVGGKLKLLMTAYSR
jgi:hypothetical protein